MIPIYEEAAWRVHVGTLETWDPPEWWTNHFNSHILPLTQGALSYFLTTDGLVDSLELAKIWRHWIYVYATFLRGDDGTTLPPRLSRLIVDSYKNYTPQLDPAESEDNDIADIASQSN